MIDAQVGLKELTMKRPCSFILCLLVLAPIVQGKSRDPNSPAELLRTRWDAVRLILEKKDIDQKTKDKEIVKIVTPLFDFPLMAKLALGRKHWPKLRSPQRERLTLLFVERLRRT